MLEPQCLVEQCWPTSINDQFFGVLMERQPWRHEPQYHDGGCFSGCFSPAPAAAAAASAERLWHWKAGVVETTREAGEHEGRIACDEQRVASDEYGHVSNLHDMIGGNGTVTQSFPCVQRLVTKRV